MHKNASATADSAPDSDGELTALPANTMAGFERERKREGRGMGERENVREEGRRTPPARNNFWLPRCTYAKATRHSCTISTFSTSSRRWSMRWLISMTRVLLRVSSWRSCTSSTTDVSQCLMAVVMSSSRPSIRCRCTSCDVVSALTSVSLSTSSCNAVS